MARKQETDTRSNSWSRLLSLMTAQIDTGTDLLAEEKSRGALFGVRKKDLGKFEDAQKGPFQSWKGKKGTHVLK